MAVSLKHNFVSPVTDEGNADEVSPNDWNAEHDLTLATAKVLGRTTAGAGAVEEVDLSGSDTTVISGTAGTSGNLSQWNGDGDLIDAGVVAANLTEVLTADRTYYVRTDGSDSNDGLSDSSGGAFLTIQFALNTALSISTGGDNDIFIQVGNGTYSEDILISGPLLSGGSANSQPIHLIGDETTPANVIISSTSNCIEVSGVTGMRIAGFRFTASSNYASAVVATSGAFVHLQNCDMHTMASTYGTHITCLGGSRITGGNGITITDDAGTFVSIANNSYVALFGSIAIPTAVAFNTTVFVNEGGVLRLNSGFSGSGEAGTTGKRFAISSGGVIRNFGRGINDIPGDSAGTVEAGHYDDEFEAHWTVGDDGELLLPVAGGYSDGGTVTQATSRTTGVTLNTASGQITLVSAAGSATPATFTVTNSQVTATDTIIVNQSAGADLYETHVTAIGAGSFNITFFTTGGTTTEQPVFNYAVIKGASS